jgi:hypothetical protein
LDAQNSSTALSARAISLDDNPQCGLPKRIFGLAATISD